VVETVAVAHEQLAVGQGEQSPKAQGEGDPSGGTEDNSRQNERVPRGRVAAVILLLLGAVGILLWLFLDRPETQAGTVALVIIASTLVGVSSFFLLTLLPVSIYRRLAAVVGVAVTFGALIATLLTIPPESSDELSTSTTASESAAPPSGSSATQSPSSSLSGDLMTYDLDFDQPTCEAFAVPRSLLSLLPKTKSEVTAEWIYGHGGATLSTPVLTLQGKSDDAVIITAMRVTELERSTPPSDTVAIFPCGTGGGVMAVRHFELKMTDPPKVISRRGDVDPNGDRDPAIKLPVKVSNGDPEIFVLKITGPPCFCAWNLEIDWKSGGQRGTMTVTRRFGKIRSDTVDLRQYDEYSLEDGKWEKY
jgi:hypothetical protein